VFTGVLYRVVKSTAACFYAVVVLLLRLRQTEPFLTAAKLLLFISKFERLQDIFSKVDKSGEGVCVQASTLGSLEALLSFLDSPEVRSFVETTNLND
jgi:hypothetical protein